MSDSLEPPAKKARLEADAPFSGASATALDAPGSPVDDLDDDFYDTTPVKPSAQPAADGEAVLFAAAAATTPASFQLPGLGAVGKAPAAQPQLPDGAPSDVHEDDASEEGELSDDDAFYNDASAFDAPSANQVSGQIEAPQHGKLSRLKRLVVFLTLPKMLLLPSIHPLWTLMASLMPLSPLP